MAKKIGKGKEITELVKGSMDYTMESIRKAFRLQFPYSETHDYWIVEIFADYVIVNDWRSADLKTDEYWKVAYTPNGQGEPAPTYTFVPADQWEIVELTYKPQSVITESKKKTGTRMEEAIAPGQIELLEAKDEAKGIRRIRINELVVANVVNGNNRLYEAEIIEAMVADWRSHLRESAGQGRLKILTGEADHPADKGKKRTEFLETVVNWDTLDWNGERLNIEGNLILTSKGKDVEILMEAGVLPGGSIRGMGESKIEKVGGKKVEKVLWISMNGVDLVGDPSFKNTAELFESNQNGEDDMNLLEQLKALMAEHPDLFPGITESQLEKMNQKALEKLSGDIRTAMGLGADDNIIESVKTNAEKARKFDESERKSTVDAVITEATKDLPYGKDANAAFVEAVKDANLADGPSVKAFVESKRKEYDKLYSKKALKAKGFNEAKTGIDVVGDVLELETGTPAFAKAAFDITESVRNNENRSKRTMEMRNESPAAIFSARLLKRFDELYGAFLIKESQAIEEAELTTDLNLPYSVARAMIEEAFPNLVAANIFDVGVINTSPTRLYFERTTGESGYTGTVTDEVEVAGAENAWYDLVHGRITPGTVVVTSNPAGTTYVEGTDFVIDYAAGRIKPLTPGSIGANDVLVDYAYTAARNGEMAPIQRVKSTLDFMVITAAADRIADQISSEAIVFAKSQLGWDAVGRTMINLVKQLKRLIDQGLLYMAFSAVKAVPNNSTDAWTIGNTQEDLDDLVRLMGNANVIVANRFYEPTFYLMSVTNADRLSNWQGFMRDGFPQALINAAGFAGMVKNKPIFASTEFSDDLIIAGNRELVAHRVLNPLTIKGPFPTYDISGGTSKLVAADQYYAEEYNATESPVYEKGAWVPIEEEAS